MIQKLSRSGSDSAESEPERPFPFRDRSTGQPIALFCMTRGRFGRVEADSTQSRDQLGQVSRVGANSARSQD